MFEQHVLKTLERVDYITTVIKADILNCSRVDAQFINNLKQSKQTLSFAKQEASLKLRTIYSKEFDEPIGFWKSISIAKSLEKSLTKCEEAEDLLKDILPQKKGKKKNKA